MSDGQRLCGTCSMIKPPEAFQRGQFECRECHIARGKVLYKKYTEHTVGKKPRTGHSIQWIDFDHALGKEPDYLVARRVGCSIRSVLTRRQKLGIVRYFSPKRDSIRCARQARADGLLVRCRICDRDTLVYGTEGAPKKYCSKECREAWHVAGFITKEPLARTIHAVMCLINKRTTGGAHGGCRTEKLDRCVSV